VTPVSVNFTYQKHAIYPELKKIQLIKMGQRNLQCDDIKWIGGWMGHSAPIRRSLDSNLSPKIGYSEVLMAFLSLPMQLSGIGHGNFQIPSNSLRTKSSYYSTLHNQSSWKSIAK